MADENVRFRVSTESDLSKLLTDLDSLIRKQNDLGDENSRAIRSMNANVESHAKQYTSLSNSITGVKNLLLTAFGIDQIKEAIAKIFDLTATYQKYHAALTVSLGSQQKATEALGMLQTYADKSNFELDELADTFSKFAGRNVVMGRENMEKLGDVANAMQKPFKQLGEAILDINNTERWTDLGVKAQTAGDKVRLTFHGTTIEAERTEQAVMLATAAFGTLNGVQGATEKQALTLAGRWSSLSDATAGLAREAGNGLLPVFEAVIETGIDLAVGMKNSAQEGGLLNAMFSSLKQAGGVLWAMFTELITPIREIALKWFPSFFESGSGSNEMMKVLGVVINTVVMGPFYALITVLREGWQALQLFYNGLQGVQTGMKGVWAAITGDWDQMGVLFNQASGYFEKSKANFDKMGSIWDEMSQSVEKSNAKILNSHQVTAVSVADITTNLTKKQQEAVNAEEERWTKIKGTLQEGTSQYANAYYEHELNLLKAKDQYTGQTLSKEGEKHKKLKEAAFMSANEIAVLTKEIQEDSLKDQLALVDAKMKLEIEKINSHKVDYIKTEQDAADAIRSIVIQAEREKEAIIAASRTTINANQLDYVAKTVEIETKLTLDVQASEVQRLLNTQTTEKEKQKAKLDTLEQIRKLGEQEQKIIKETEDIEAKSQKNRIKAIIGFLGEMSPELAQFAQFAVGVVDNIDIITGKSEQFYKKQAEDAKVAMETSKVFYGETSTQFSEAKLKSAEANKDLAEAQAKTSQVSMDMSMALADLAKKVFGMLSETVAGTMDGILEGLDATAAAFQRFTDMSVQMNREMIDAVMEDTNLSFDERKNALDEFMQYEKDTLYGNERLQNEINTAKNSVELAKWQADRQGEFINNLTKGPEGIIANWKLVFTWRQEQSAREEEMARQQTIFEKNQAIQRAEAQIETYKQMADDKIRMAEELRDKEIEIEKAKNAVIENELDVLDTKRKKLLDDWLARKLKDLEDDKKLALEQAATEEEKSNIIIKYQALMEQAHKEYKEAELDKTKAVSLASTELKAQESDFVKNKENETASAVRGIQNETAALIRNANREIFEANKQITIAELQGEIAKLKAKRWFLNAGRVDSAIATIEGVISQIQGAQFGGGSIGSGGAVEGDLGINEKYRESGQKADDIANQAQRAIDTTTAILQNALSTTDWLNKLAQEASTNLSVIEEAKRKAEAPAEFAEGTEYVAGFGFPNGIDTVPAMLTKGERVLPTSLNNKLGGAALSNEKLVEGYLALEKLKQKFGNVRIEEFGRLNFDLAGGRIGTSVDLAGLEKEVKNLTDVIRSKPELKINVDANRMSIVEKSHNEQHIAYYENLYNR